MAISFVGSTSGNAANGGDITLDLTAITGLAENDLVIVAYTIGSGGDGDFNLVVNSPTDYTEVADLFSDDTQDSQLGVFYKKQASTVDTSVVVEGFANMNNSVAAVAMAFRGVDTTTPMDVTPTVVTGVSTMNPNPPSINHNAPVGVWTVIAGASGHTLGAGTSFTFPTGYTTDAISAGGNDTDDCTVGLGYRSSGVSDPEDPGTMTVTGQTDNAAFCWCACTIALRPAADTTDELLADDVTSGTPTLTSAVIGQKHALLANDITTGTPTLTSAVLGQKHILLANDIITGTPTLTSPALTEGAGTDELLANDITTGTPTLTSAALGQAHVLSANDITSGTPTLTVASLGQAHVLSADDLIISVPTLSTPVLSVSGEEEPAAEEPLFPSTIFRGRRRYSGVRPPYYWEVLKEELRRPTDKKAQKVSKEVASGLESLWADLEQDDRNFDRMLREVDHLIKRAAIYVENLRLSQLLAETKSRIEAAQDAKPETAQVLVSTEEAEIQELLTIL